MKVKNETAASTKRKLTLLFQSATCGFFTLLLLLFFFLFWYFDVKQEKELFYNHIFSVLSSLQTSTSVSVSWLAQTEAENKMLIFISNNGVPFHYKGSYIPRTSREELYLIVEETFTTNELIQAFSLTNSLTENVISLRGKNKDLYYAFGCRLILPSGYCDVKILSEQNARYLFPLKYAGLFLGAELIGLIFFILLSKFLMQKAFHPVEEAMKKQQEFTAAASHELKSPLAVIRTNVSSIALFPERKDEFQMIIEKECDRMSHLIEDMLFLSAAGSSDWPIRLKDIDAEHFFAESYEILDALCRCSKHSLNLILPEQQLPVFLADEERLLQILQILISNACCYSESNSEITLKVEVHTKHLLILVSDYGIGILPEKLTQIFDTFSRGDESRHDKSHFGLGLSIAKEIMRLHGGKISAASTYGKGSTFYLQFPL